MKITKVKYFLINRKTEKYPLANCIVILDNVILLGGIKLYEGKKGKYIVFPEKPKKHRDLDVESVPAEEVSVDSASDSEVKFIHKDEIYHPVQKDFSNYMKDVIIEGYAQAVDEKKFIYYPEIDYYTYLERLANGEEEGNNLS